MSAPNSPIQRFEAAGNELIDILRARRARFQEEQRVLQSRLSAIVEDLHAIDSRIAVIEMAFNDLGITPPAQPAPSGGPLPTPPAAPTLASPSPCEDTPPPPPVFHLNAVPDPHHTTIALWIRAKLRYSPTQSVKVGELVKELMSNNHSQNQRTIKQRTDQISRILRLMAERGEVTRIKGRRGLYRLPDPPAEQ